MTPFAETVTLIISLGVIITNILTLVLLGVLAFASQENVVRVWVVKRALMLSTITALGATLGSLIYSSIIGFVPCELCWWQRVFLIPQAIIFFISWVRAYFFKKPILDNSVFVYSLVLSLIGGAISTFHYYGQMFNPAALAGCEANGISCSKLYFVEFGYITIPMMALSTFALLFTIALIRLRTK